MSDDKKLPSAEEARDTALKLFKQLLADDDWKNPGEKDGITTHSKPFPGSSIDAFKGVLKVKGSAKQLASASFNRPVEVHKKWDPNFGGWELVERYSDTLTCEHYVSKMPWPVWNRDALSLHALVEEDGVFYELYYRYEHPKKPLDAKKNVRAFCNCSAIRYEEKDGEVTMTRVVQIDPSGSLPGWLVNQNATFQVVTQLKNTATLAQA